MEKTHTPLHRLKLISSIPLQSVDAGKVQATCRTRNIRAPCTVRVAEISFGNVEFPLLQNLPCRSANSTASASSFLYTILHSRVVVTYSILQYRRGGNLISSAYCVQDVLRNMSDTCTHNQEIHVPVNRFVVVEILALSICYISSSCCRSVVLSLWCFCGHKRKTSPELVLNFFSPFS